MKAFCSQCIRNKNIYISFRILTATYDILLQFFTNSKQIIFICVIYAPLPDITEVSEKQTTLYNFSSQMKGNFKN